MPCTWIRYNPDDFKGQKSSLKEFDRRDLLLRMLYDSICDIPTTTKDFLRIKHLFFDHHKQGVIIPYEYLLFE